MGFLVILALFLMRLRDLGVIFVGIYEAHIHTYFGYLFLVLSGFWISAIKRVFPGLKPKYYVPWYVVLLWSKIVKTMVCSTTMVFTILLQKSTTYWVDSFFVSNISGTKTSHPMSFSSIFTSAWYIMPFLGPLFAKHCWANRDFS